MRYLKVALVSIAMLALIGQADARGRRGRSCSSCGSGGCQVQQGFSYAQPIQTITPVSGERLVPLDDINAQRAASGLAAYVRDEGLEQAALAAATYRATYGIQGHTGNDFAFLPAGASSPCAGCAAWPADLPFGACDTHAGWRRCGAATVRGADGLLYHHAFYGN